MFAKNKKSDGLVKNKIRHLVKLAVVPHKKNEYRPHLIRHYGLLVIIFTVIGSQVIFSNVMADVVAGKQTDITVNTLLEQTNKEREQAGLVALKLNDKLNQAAESKARDMLDKQYWAHESPDNIQPWKWLETAGYKYSKAGENLAKDYVSTEAVMAAWMNSTEHRENILDPDYQDVGFAVVDGEYQGRLTELIVSFYGLSAMSAATNAQNSFFGAVLDRQRDAWSLFIVASKSITPLTVICLTLILLAIVVAMWSHFHRKKLPVKFQKSWKKHHGLYKSVGLLVFALATVLISATGQI